MERTGEIDTAESPATLSSSDGVRSDRELWRRMCALEKLRGQADRCCNSGHIVEFRECESA
ncbi:MAG: hypothetical protein MUQ27_03395, partial [Acidimicrobiia bacterium]|nr:hypothetical protein [Acidimicrobiia bacterium]